MSNKLIFESSPYLQQHANNPVHWFPWSDEAFNKAIKEKKPVFLSIGYSSCHWCHVMEKESFENQEIAEIMNTHFINIKVDREERPDIDSIYMQAVQAISGQGGWPLSVFLTPSKKPFYGGTYFPPEDRSGIPSFPRVLLTVSKTFKEKQSELENHAETITTQLEKSLLTLAKDSVISTELITRATKIIEENFDSEYGGFSKAPKFPQVMIIEFLLQLYAISKNKKALSMATITLEKMAKGGIFDQIGGGFHRYSTDDKWLIPHFEKMLYDNALLIPVYLHAFQITKNSLFENTAINTIEYIIEEMTDSNGGFYSAEDADSEGEEGTYYLWDIDEIKEILDTNITDLFEDYFGITKTGNFEGKNILHIPENTKESKQISHKKNTAINLAKILLQKKRKTRPRPFKDKKIICSWNGMMIKAMAEAGKVLKNQKYIQYAEKTATFILNNLYENNRLHRTHINGKTKLKAYLEDYAYLIDGLLALHSSTLEPKWLEISLNLTNEMIDLYWNKNQEIFYDTGKDHEELIVRPRDIFDTAIPCGNSKAIEILQILSNITEKPEYKEISTHTIESMGSWIGEHPLGFSQWLINLLKLINTNKQLTILTQNPKTTNQILTELNVFDPLLTIFGKNSLKPSSIDNLETMHGKNHTKENEITAFFCVNKTCSEPLTSIESIKHIFKNNINL